MPKKLVTTYTTRRTLAPPPTPYDLPAIDSSSFYDLSTSSTGEDEDDEPWSTKKDSLTMKQSWTGKGKKGKSQKASKSTRARRKRAITSTERQEVDRTLSKNLRFRKRQEQVGKPMDQTTQPVKQKKISRKSRVDHQTTQPTEVDKDSSAEAVARSATPQELSAPVTPRIKPKKRPRVKFDEGNNQVRKIPNRLDRAICESSLSTSSDDTSTIPARSIRFVLSSDSSDTGSDGHDEHPKPSSARDEGAIIHDKVNILLQAAEQVAETDDKDDPSTANGPDTEVTEKAGQSADSLLITVQSRAQPQAGETDQPADDLRQGQEMTPLEAAQLTSKWTREDFSLATYLSDDPDRASATGELLKTLSPGRWCDFVDTCDKAGYILPPPSIRRVGRDLLTTFHPSNPIVRPSWNFVKSRQILLKDLRNPVEESA